MPHRKYSMQCSPDRWNKLVDSAKYLVESDYPESLRFALDYLAWLKDSAPDLKLRDLPLEILSTRHKSHSTENPDESRAISAVEIAVLLEVLDSVLAESEALSGLRSFLQLCQSNPETPVDRMFARFGPSDPNTGLPRCLEEIVARLGSRLHTLKRLLAGHTFVH